MLKLTRFEKARLISARSLQLSLGAPPLVKPNDESTAYSLAKAEFEEKLIPLIVLRKMPNGEVLRIPAN
ncbi:MAG: DNA-directed RNA polymerase subunit K [Candidatus Diapherotrites archaeon]|nr:DNA-directed RNA polymerase subunit K [Candidatus Diapherotrites archaeon]